MSALKLLHTADWHLGRRFPTFSEADELKLTRARLEVASVVERLRVAAGEDGELAQRALYHLYKEVTAGNQSSCGMGGGVPPCHKGGSRGDQRL